MIINNEIDYYTPLLQSPSIFNESLLLNEMWLPGFNNKMTEKLLQHLGKMAQTREFTSNSIFSTIYNLIDKKKISLQFSAKYPSIVDFYFCDDNVNNDVIGGYNFQTRKIEIYIKWTSDAKFIVDYSIDEISQALKRQKMSDGKPISGDYIMEMNTICNKIYAILLSEGLLIYDYKNKGKLSQSETVRDWYFEYFRDVLNDTLKRTSLGENLGALIAEKYGPYMYEKVEKKIIEGKHVGIKVDAKNASPDFEMEGIPQIKKGDKETSDIWEDIIIKIAENNQSKLRLDRSTYVSLKEFAKEFGIYGKFLYDHRDLRLLPDNLAQSSDSTVEVYKSSSSDEDADRAKEEKEERTQKEFALKRAQFINKNKKEFYEKDSHYVQDEVGYKWYKQLKNDEKYQRESNRQLIDNEIKKINSGAYKKIKPGETYIAKFLLPKNEDEKDSVQEINCSLSDVRVAYQGVKKALGLYNASQEKLNELISDSKDKMSNEVQKASHMVLAQRSQLNAYYTDFWKLMHSSITKGTSLENLFKESKPQFSNIDKILEDVGQAIDNYKANNTSFLPKLFNKDDDNINVSRTYTHAKGLLKYGNLASRQGRPDTLLDIWKHNVSNTAAKQLDALEDSIIEEKERIRTAIDTLSANDKSDDAREAIDKLYEDVYKKIQQCGFIGRAYTGQLKKNEYSDEQKRAIEQERSQSSRGQLLKRAIIHNINVKEINDQDRRLIGSVPKHNDIVTGRNIKSFIDQRYAPDYLDIIRFGIDRLKTIVSKKSQIPNSKDKPQQEKQVEEISKVLNYTITKKDGNQVNLANATDEDILYHFNKYYLGNGNSNEDASIKASRVDNAMDQLFSNLKKGTKIARNFEYNYNKRLLMSDDGIRKSKGEELKTSDAVQTMLQLLQKKQSNIDEYEGQEEARLRGIEILDVLKKPGKMMTKKDLELLEKVVEKITGGELRTMEEARKILNVSNEDRKIGTKEAYYRSLFMNGLSFIPTIGESLIIKGFQGIKNIGKKLYNFVKDAADIVTTMFDKGNKILYDYANKRFGFKNMALMSYFDDAYKNVAGIKKVYKENHNGTIRKNMVYCELYMPVTILQKILYMRLTTQNEYTAEIIYLIQCSNKGLQEFLGKGKSPFKENEKQNNDNAK